MPQLLESDEDVLYWMKPAPGQFRIEYLSYKLAIEAIEKNLAAGNTGAMKVYRINIPGTEQTLIGTRYEDLCQGEYQGLEIDFKDIRSTAHLPYEILVQELNT